MHGQLAILLDKSVKCVGGGETSNGAVIGYHSCESL